jgi:hypothetical protein
MFCPICKSSSKQIDSVKTINPNSELLVNLLECDICKHWFIEEAPSQEELSTMYSSNSEYVVPKGYCDEMIDAKFNVSDKLAYLQPKYKFNYLELGVGSGQLFNYFKKTAEKAYGVDPGSWGLDENIVQDIKDVSPIGFDLIVATDVMEHLNNPLEMLNKLNELANDNCTLYFTVPNKDSLKAQIQKGKWSMTRPFGHLHFFSKKSIKKSLELSGWNVVKIKSMRAGNTKIFELLKYFYLSSSKLIYRIIKSLIIGQILLGKDQWEIIAIKK